jgi:hypothetical protein
MDSDSCYKIKNWYKTYKPHKICKVSQKKRSLLWKLMAGSISSRRCHINVNPILVGCFAMTKYLKATMVNVNN